MRRLPVLLAALGALLLVSAAPAFAAGELELKETFGSAAQPSFTKAGSMAVDPASGDLLVVDLGSQSVKRFNPNGTAANFTALDTNVIDGASGADETPLGEILSTEGSVSEAEVAVAPPSAGATAGDIYVTNAFNEEIDIFAPSGEYIGNQEFPGEGYPCGVAVSPSGTVFVGEYYEGVYKFEPTAPGELSEVAQFPAEEGTCQVAAGSGPSAGYVFMATLGASGPVTKMDATTGAVKYVVDPHYTSAIGIDPTSGYLYAAGASNLVAFDVSGASEASEVSSTPISAPFGVAADGSTHDVYVARNSQPHVFVYSQPEPGAEGPPLTTTIESGEGTVVSNPAGIECTGSAPHECTTEEIAEGETVTLTASPAAGYQFKSWKYCDSGGVHGRQCTITLTAGHKPVGAKFAAANDVSVEKAGNGTGSITGVTCGNTCTAATGSIVASKTVTLKAKPYAKNSEFIGWNASPVSCTLSEEGKTCSLGTLSANETAEAEFAEQARENLTVAKSGSGQGSVKSAPAGINCSYTCGSNTAYFYKGTSVTLTAAVQVGKGSELGNWGGACSGSEATPCVVSMSSAKSVTAEFK